MTKPLALMAPASVILILATWQGTCSSCQAQEADAATVEEPAVDESGEAADSEPPKTQLLTVNDKLLNLAVPVAWQMVEPRNRLIEVELAILPSKDGEQPTPGDQSSEEAAPRGRLTMMAAGGDVDSNIRRWIGQFRLGRDADGKDAMRRDELKLRGAVAHVLDIAGTYFDSPRGPFGPKVERADYRMLGAIIEIEGAGKYFVKFYGPADLVEENREAFEEMLSSLEVMQPESRSDESAKEDAEPSATDQSANS